MKLQTLGGLGLIGSGFTQPKPLLLLAYLALEGPQPRAFLAELFWPQGESRKSLSMAITRLHGVRPEGSPELVQADARRVRAAVASDVQELVGALERRDFAAAGALYGGGFLEGAALGDLGTELSEWVYSTREYLAGRVQYGLLGLAEEAAKTGRFGEAGRLAERAYRLPGLGGSELAALRRLYALLCAGGSPLAPSVRREAEEYGVTLSLTTAEARLTFTRRAAVNTLPMRGTSFVGRGAELAELGALLGRPDVSLLSLLGPAGVGKTRLALQLAYEQEKLERFRDGVYFVALDTLGDASLLVPNVLNHLGLSHLQGAEPLAGLAAALAERHVLLVLDNFEPLVEAGGVLSELLGRCPNLKLLVTSRERLRLEEEHVFPVLGLPYAAPFSADAGVSEAQVSDAGVSDAGVSDAVQLFTERARQVDPRFDPRRELADVVTVCRCVEGLPLGIELAASWVRLMPCADIAAELARSLELLATTTRNVPERHRSLQAAFDSSWKLLTAREQGVLGKLAVFRGGFRREAASAVTGATIPVLAALVDKSLLRVTPQGRYLQHPLIYGCARAKLLESGEYPAVEAEHGRYYLRLVQAQEAVVQGGRQRDALRVFQEERENCCLMAEKILAGDDQDLLRWVDLVDTFYDIQGAYGEALTFLTRAEARLSARPETRALSGRVSLEKGYALAWLGLFDRAEDAVRTGLASIPGTERRWRARGLNTLGIIAYNQGRNPEAAAYWREALALATATDYRVYQAHITGNLGIVATAAGDLQGAERYHSASLRLYRELGAVNGSAREQINMAATYFLQGELDKAVVAAADGLKLAREIEYKLFIPYGLTGVARIDYALGNYRRACDGNREALELGRETQDTYVQVEALTGLTLAATALGDYPAAANYSERALELAREIGSDSRLAGAVFAGADLLAALGRYEHAARLAFVVCDHPATEGYERSLAEKLAVRVQVRLSDGQRRSARALARTLSLDRAAAEAAVHISY